MTDRNKFEEMLERLINEDKAGAEELFHEIVVEKSRDIYESLLESDEDEVDETTDEEVDETTDEEVDETTDEEVDESDDEDVNEDFDLDEFEVEADPMANMGGDPAEDMIKDMEVGGEEGDEEEGDEEGEESESGDMEGAIDDLSAALDKLRAEFDAEFGGESDEMDMGDDEGDEEGDEEADDEMDMGGKEGEEGAEEESFAARITPLSAGEQMREYVEKVNGGFGAKIGGDNGVGNKSIVAGKNPLGNTGTTANIVKGGESNSGGSQGGLAAPTTKEDNAGNVNVPGGKAGKTGFKKSEPGHGAEKKGKGDNGANTKSIVGK
jgi:hypothetical protein